SPTLSSYVPAGRKLCCDTRDSSYITRRLATFVKDSPLYPLLCDFVLALSEKRFGRTLKNRSNTVSKLLDQVSTTIRMRTLLQVFKDQRLGLIRWSDLAHLKVTKARSHPVL